MKTVSVFKETPNKSFLCQKLFSSTTTRFTQQSLDENFNWNSQSNSGKRKGTFLFLFKKKRLAVQRCNTKSWTKIISPQKKQFNFRKNVHRDLRSFNLPLSTDFKSNMESDSGWFRGPEDYPRAFWQSDTLNFVHEYVMEFYRHFPHHLPTREQVSIEPFTFSTN
jgi:hypothetical protein